MINNGFVSSSFYSHFGFFVFIGFVEFIEFIILTAYCLLPAAFYILSQPVSNLKRL